MSLTRAIAWNTGAQLAGKLISTALGVIVIGLMTRRLGQDGFGAYSTANAFLQIFALLMDLGLNVTLVAMLGEHAGDEKWENRCVSAAFTLRLVLAVILLGAAAPLVSLLFPYSWEIKLAIIALTGSFFFPTLNQIIIGVQQRHLKTYLSAVGEIIGRVVLLAGLFVAMWAGWGLVPIVLMVTLGSLANFIWCLITSRHLASFRWNWDPEFWLVILKRSWPIGLAIAFNLLYYKADTLILSLVRSQAEVGIYGAAYRVLELLITVPFMYAGVVLPIMAGHWARRDIPALNRLISRSFDVIMLMMAPLLAGTLILGNRIMATVAGPAFAASGDILRVLAIAVAAVYVSTVFTHAVVALNAQRAMLPINIGVAILTLVGYIFLIPRYGMWAAAWLTVISEVCILIGSLALTRMRTPFVLEPKTPLAAIGATLMMVLVIYPLREANLAWPVLTGAVIYCLFVYLFGGISKETLKEILRLNKGSAALPPTSN